MTKTEKVSHTPPPWTIKGVSLYAGHNGPKTLITDGKFLIADVSDQNKEVGEAEANARLISAAPELLAALKRCRANTMKGIIAWTTAEEAAIAKAEGK